MRVNSAADASSAALAGVCTRAGRAAAPTTNVDATHAQAVTPRQRARTRVPATPILPFKLIRANSLPERKKKPEAGEENLGSYRLETYLRQAATSSIGLRRPT